MPEWKSYEEVARYVIKTLSDYYGISEVEAEKEILGLKSGTTWKIEGLAQKQDANSFLIIECKRYTKSRIKQEIVGGVAYRISDTGASGAIIVTPLGLQTGASKVAEAENIQVLQLDPGSSLGNFIARANHQLVLGVSESVSLGIGLVGGSYKKVVADEDT